MERLAATTTGKMGLCGFLLIVLVLPAIAADWAESSDPRLRRARK